MNIRFEYRITALYLLLGCLWIVFSDKFLSGIIQDPAMLTTFQTYKGWFFVIITAIIFHTILKNHLIKLRKAEMRARESDNLKTAFLHNISHEIRTPMNSIIGFSELLRKENLSDEKRNDYITIINSSSNQLLQIVEGIVDISIIESGNNIIMESKVNLNSILDDVYSIFNSRLKLSIDFSVNKGLPDSGSHIITDEAKLTKTLKHLLSNAFKFTEKGNISFGYTVKKNFIEFFVNDTGAGIPEELQQQIFRCFQKGEEKSIRFHDGLGLGLSICKAHIELMDGNIWVRSRAGEGSTFYFTIPYKPVPGDGAAGLKSVKK